MTRNKLTPKEIKFAGIISLLLLSLASYPPQVQAHLTQSLSNRVVNTRNLLAQNFPDNGEPRGRRRGGGTRRGGCPNLKTPLTALVPGDETNNQSFWTSTVAEYPSFWVYVPELPTNLRSGEFVLQDEKGKDIWRQPITLPGKSGAIGISLPENPQYALKQGSKYHWYFFVYCDSASSKSEYFYVDAWVQRIALTSELEQQLKTAKQRQYSVYAANNLWYDALTNLAELRSTNSDSPQLADDWTKMLNAVGLGELAQAPIVQNYRPQK